MIKFTMGSSGNQKTHRRKPKRSTKSYTGYQNTAGGGGLCMPAVGLKSTVLPSSSLSATSTVISSSSNTSVDSSKLLFSPVMNFWFYIKLTFQIFWFLVFRISPGPEFGRLYSVTPGLNVHFSRRLGFRVGIMVRLG